MPSCHEPWDARRISGNEIDRVGTLPPWLVLAYLSDRTLFATGLRLSPGNSFL